MRPTPCITALLLALAVIVGVQPADALPEEGDRYEIGGPLAGLKLPPYPTQHGETPGFPGAIPERDEKGGEKYPVQGNPMLFELYPGSVEQWRQVLHRYVPARPMYDKQSQVRNWTAPALPGAQKGQVGQYAAPLYWVGSHTQLKFTGKHLKPVPVVRCGAKAPVFDLDFGELEYGMYVVRIIGAVPTDQIRVFRKPLFIKMRVNDGVKGEESEYCIRIGYVDEFYSVAEIYFQAPQTRKYRAKVWVDEGSEVDLLVHNISLDDALAGTVRRAIKTRAIWPDTKERRLHPDHAKSHKITFTPEERRQRDEAIWRAFPPLNAHYRIDDYIQHVKRGTQDGIKGMARKAVQEAHGKWESPKVVYSPFVYVGAVGAIFTDKLDDLRVFLKNDKYGLKYTVDDWYAQKPLPGPYPYADDGCGITTPDPNDGNTGQLWSPIASAVNRRLYDYFCAVIHGAKLNHPKYARDRAVALIRLAYQFPSLDNANALLSLVHTQPGQYDTRCRRRNTESRLPWTHVHIQLVKVYDEIYPAIKGDEDLARSVSRFVPWVKSSEDLIELLDVYLAQTQAKRLMRYNYYRDGHPALIADTATILDDPTVTDPMMAWLFARTWMYPLRSSGLQDYLISNNDRAGISYIGSISYGRGAAAYNTAGILEDYVKNGGSPKYDLRDPKRYPKSAAGTLFTLRERIAAIHWPRIGDVTGPDKQARWEVPPGSDVAWRWLRDPRAAFILKHYTKLDGFTPEERKEIEAAAATIARAPWLDNESRIVPNWAAILEAGVEHDDFRFRRAIALRLGQGMGHSHADTFDLQIFAHGIPMVVDAGQRGGYSKPSDALRSMHNTVDVMGGAGVGGMWTRALSDMPGARYVAADTKGMLYRRQVALVDVSEGSGAKPLTPAQCLYYDQGLPKHVETPNSYVFDVFRVATPEGQAKHTYCFHGPVNDLAASGGPQPITNLKKLDPASDATAAAYLQPFSGDKYAGRAPEKLEVTFQVQQERTTKPKVGAGTEHVYLARAFDPDAPVKYLRWHLMNAEGALVMKGDLHCHRWEYYIPNFFVQRSGEGLQSAFAAVIEPYAGKPFITSVRQLPVAGNENDALRAVAVEVKTIGGHTDLCFADGRPEKTRQVGDAQCAGEFAYVSTDAQGVRQVSLSGGTLLAMPNVRLAPAAREYRATVTKVDYPNKILWVDKPLPRTASKRVFEIGTLPQDGEGYATAYTAVSIAPEGQAAVIRTEGGADLYRARIVSVDEEKGIVQTAIRKPVGAFGFEKRFVASNETMTKFWRAEMHEGDRRAPSHPIILTGADVKAEDFQPHEAIRLWEYGVGDTVRMSTFATLRRVAPGVFELRADVDVTLGLAGRRIEISPDGKAWTTLDSQRDDRLAVATVPVSDLTTGAALLRVR